MFFNMYGFEVNKILASIIIAIILLIIIGFIGNFIVKLDQEENQATAYIIDISNISNDSTMQKSANNEVESISLLLVDASPEKGEKIFNKCKSCHNYKKDGKSKIDQLLDMLIFS